jgi:hypothetical protein
LSLVTTFRLATQKRKVEFRGKKPHIITAVVSSKDEQLQANKVMGRFTFKLQ